MEAPFERWRVDKAMQDIENGITTLQDRLRDVDVNSSKMANELDKAIGDAGRAYSRLQKLLAKGE